MWCSLPSTHLFIAPTGQIKPCCRFQGREVPAELNTDQLKLKEVFFGAEWTELRRKMREGEKVVGCRRCSEEEAAGKKLSLRQNYNRRLPELDPHFSPERPRIRFLELGLSNLCNLKCRMCDSRYSTAWQKDEQLLYPEKKMLGLQKVSMESLEGLWPDLRHVKFTGGEPLLIREHLQVVENLVELGHPQETVLNYSTNATQKPSSALVKLWSRFKRVEIALSIDGFGSVNDYVRHPSHWEQVEEVTESFTRIGLDNMQLGIRPSVSIYNILSLPELLKWWGGRSKWISLTHVTYPDILSLPVLPKVLKEFIRGQLRDFSPAQNLLRYMDSADHSARWPEFVSYTRKLDQLRGENVLEVCPWLEGHLDTVDMAFPVLPSSQEIPAALDLE